MKKRLLTLLTVLALCQTLLPTVVLADTVDYQVWVGGTQVTPENAEDVLDDGTVSYDAESNTLTLTDAAISNENGDGIRVIGRDITIIGVDTDAEGSNTISGSSAAVYGTKNITFKGAFGNITGGSNGGIYSVVGSSADYPGGDIHIETGAVLGDISSNGYTLLADKGDIIIDGEIGDVSGTSGFAAEINGDIVINGKVGNVTGTEYGMYAHKSITIAKGAEVGNITGGGTAGMISFESDVVISGKAGNISGITYGAFAWGGTLTIDGQVSQFSGQCPICAAGDINIGGTVDSITGHGGAGNTGSSYGIRSAGGKISISSTIGPVTASSNGEGKTIIALVAKNGIELAKNVAIKIPANNKIDLYGTSNYTVYDLTDNSVAKRVEFASVYQIVFHTNGGSEVMTQTVVNGETAVKPADPTMDGYTFGGWYMDEACTVTYDFSTAVTENIPLYAKWEEASSGSDMFLPVFGGAAYCPSEGYADVDVDAWYHDAVDYVLENGLMTGVAENSFAPNGTMTRAMVWTVLGRISGEEFNGTGANWYAQAQNWAIINGVSDGTNPNGAVTREELVTMLWRFVGEPEADAAAIQWYYDGETASDWAKEAMAWAVECAIIEGANWNLNPQATALRSQVAAILMRYCG